MNKALTIILTAAILAVPITTNAQMLEVGLTQDPSIGTARYVIDVSPRTSERQERADTSDRFFGEDPFGLIVPCDPNIPGACEGDAPYESCVPGTVQGCQGLCWPESGLESYLGNGTCDYAFACEQFDFDLGDCTSGQDPYQDDLCDPYAPGACDGKSGGDSCVNRCGDFDDTAPCQCDGGCEEAGDCCLDACIACGIDFSSKCTEELGNKLSISYTPCMNLCFMDSGFFNECHAGCQGLGIESKPCMEMCVNEGQDPAYCSEVCGFQDDEGTNQMPEMDPILASWIETTEYAPPPKEQTKPALVYDQNSDGSTDILDVVKSILYVLEGGSDAGDVNGDGSCDVTDIVLVIKGALDLIDPYGFKGDVYALSALVCNNVDLNLITDSGSYFATMPQLIIPEGPSGEAFVQEPSAGTALQPGPFPFSVTAPELGENLCNATGFVKLDLNGGVDAGIEYIEAGENGVAILGSVPQININNPYDELGCLHQIDVMVDGVSIDGTDLWNYPELFMNTGIHKIDVYATDCAGRTSKRSYSEGFITVSIYEANLLLGGGYFLFGNEWHTPISGIGITDGCTCRLVKKRVARKDANRSETYPQGSAPLAGQEDYGSIGQNLWWFRTFVSALWAPNSLASEGLGWTKDNFSIVCVKDYGAVEDCEECCEEPIIIATVEAHIGGMKAYTSTMKDSARMKVVITGSGLGEYSGENRVISGFEKWSYAKGFTATANAGIGTSKEKGGAANAGLELSSTTTVTYEGTSVGNTASAAVPPTNITGWAKACEKQHTRSVTFDSSLFASNGKWEGFWNGHHIAKAHLGPDQANMVYLNYYFRCDGVAPSIGQDH